MHQLGQRLEFQKAMTESVLDLAPVVVSLLDSEKKVLLDNQAINLFVPTLKAKSQLICSWKRWRVGQILASATVKFAWTCMEAGGHAGLPVQW